MKHEGATDISLDSWLVKAGRETQPGSPLNVPLVPASNFVLGSERGGYSRNDGTPTWEALEEVVGRLEAGRAVAFASGMAAAAALFDRVPAGADRVPVGASIVLPDDCYQGVTSLAVQGATKGRWSVRTLPLTDTASWVEACATADLIWLESPSNPLLTVADLGVVCAAPRRPGAVLVVDNTFATPLNQQPLDLGATVSLQSVTKLIGGHSDLLAGVLTTRDPDLFAALKSSRALLGATPGILESFLAVRGARTLALRLRQAQATALELAQRLEAHPLVARVRYPGLPSHPTHDVAKRVLKGYGTVISFDLLADTGSGGAEDGGAAFADAVCLNTRLITHATSLGGVESTMERRAAVPGQTHLPPTLLRLSVGIEDVEDLWNDLDTAIRASAT